MITTNVYTRIMMLNFNDSIGTCFTIEHNNRQYIITAKHVVNGLKNNDTVNIVINHINTPIKVQLVGHCKDPIDITVFCTDKLLTDTFVLPPTMEGIVWGQDVYFLGYPYGNVGKLDIQSGPARLPFVKKAILSCMENVNGVNVMYLDGHNNPGFSGGPVVFRNIEKKINEMNVCGVISGYSSTNEPIFQGNNTLPLTYKYNTGIIISYNIQHAIDLIDLNPIGFKYC